MAMRFGETPAKIIPFLEFYDIHTDEVIACVHSDWDIDFNNIDGYLFFTKDYLYLLIINKKDGKTDPKDPEQSSLQKFDIGVIKSSSIFPQVVGGLFLIEVDGVEQPVVAFSNTYLKMFYKMDTLFKKRLNNEEITEPDFIETDVKEACPKCGMYYPEEGRQVCPKCLDKRSLFFRTISYFKPYYKYFIGISACILINAGMNVIIPFLSGRVLYDQILNKKANLNQVSFLGDKEPLVALLIIVLVLLLVRVMQQLFGIIQGRLVAGFVPKAVYTIKTEIYQSMQRLSMNFFSQRQTGGLLTRIQNDASEVMQFFIDGLPYFLVNILILVGASVVMFLMNWKLAIFAVAFIPFLFFSSYLMLPRLFHLYGKRHRTVRNMNSTIQDNIVGARVVKAFGQEKAETGRFSKVSTRVRDTEIDLVNYDNRFYGTYVSVETLSSLLVWGIGSWFVLRQVDNLTYGTLITFIGYVGMLNGPLDFMSFIFRWWSMSMNSSQRIFEVIDAIPDIKEISEPVRREKLMGDIEMKNVTFSYTPNKKVLDNVSLHIKAGELFGIVGQSGAGKTTIINLISRFYDPKEGEIFIDGIPLKSLAIEDIRNNIAIVSQETYIFQGTIAQNIAYAKPDCTNKEILYASIMANAHDFICKMPHGYDTVVGSGAKSLSGGEKQRISIARAILVNPQILILDEATSSVDTQTEQKIQDSLNYLIVGRTTISIAHRLSTLKNADHLIVLENGKVVEEGTHMELVKQKGVFYKLIQLQSKALAMRGVGE
ncbi:MAG: ABC transporter ATP-binding protein [Saccharofermentanales bacterium]